MELINYVLNSPAAQLVIFLIKVVGLLFFLVASGVIIFCLKVSPFIRLSFWQNLMEIRNQKAYGAGKVEKQWLQTKKRLESQNAADWKLAVIEAESLLEEVLARLGFGGESFGERLKKVTKEQLPSLEDLVRAHETRNNIIHDPDYRLEQDAANRVVDVYGRCLQEMNAL